MFNMEPVIDAWITKLLDSVEIAFNRFTSYCDLALIVQLKNNVDARVYDPDDLLSQISMQELHAALSGAHDQGVTGIQTHFVQNVLPGDIRIFYWFFRPAAGTNTSEILIVWLQSVSELFFKLWTTAITAPFAFKVCIEQIQHSTVQILEEFVRMSKRDKNFAYPLAQAFETIRLLSIAVEEGQKPSGSLVFLRAPETLKLCRFTEPGLVVDHKHACKLLALGTNGCVLVSDGYRFLGLSELESTDENILRADFTYGIAQVTTTNGLPVCRVVNGIFKASEDDLKTIIFGKLQDYFATPLLDTAVAIAQRCVEESSGCTLVLDPRDASVSLSGQRLEEPMETNNENLLYAMSKVDGAIQLNGSGCVVAFGCLLDGLSTGFDEIRSRGSRYNSGRRFALQPANKDLGVIVISSDGPVSLFANNSEVYSTPSVNSLKQIKEHYKPASGINLSRFLAQNVHHNNER